MKPRSILLRLVLAVLVLTVVGGYWLWDSYRVDEQPVILLSRRMTLGPDPQVIGAPRGTSARGSSFWLTVYLSREKVCKGSEWTKEEAKHLPVIQAVAVTSDGQRHAMGPSDCCAAGVCGALTLHGYTSDPDGSKRLAHVIISAPEATVIDKITWETGGMQPVNFFR